MKEFIDKLIERLEEERKIAYNTYMNYEMNVDLGRAFGAERAIDIVNQLAEEYKVSEMPTGWIPCSERLPQVNGWYLVTNELGVVQQQYWGASHWQKLRDEAVIAWCELPAPYTEGE